MKTNWKKGDWIILPPRASYTLDNKLLDPNYLGKYGRVAFDHSYDGLINVWPFKISIVPAPEFNLSEVRKPNFEESSIFLWLIIKNRIKSFIHYQKISWKNLIGKS